MTSPTAEEVQALGLDALAQLQALAAQQDNLWRTPTGELPDDDDRDAHDKRQADEVALTDAAMRVYAEATGRCADHFTIGITYALTDATRRCRNRAKAPGPLCGTHQPSWDHRLTFARHRVQANARLRESQAVADALRVYGLDPTGIGADHVALSLDDARHLIAHLARTGGLA